MPARGIGYRPEIDGLRALAVVPVILFHAGYGVVSGGYVGVDVFFVISGYLITSIILAEIQAETFTLAGFYERRARRILPALTLVVASSIFAGLWLMTPVELREFSESVVAVALFISNFHFMLETGYFATAAELKPLLHTWSLAVEEQYYLVAPLVILLMSRWRRAFLVALTVALAAASLAFAQWASRELPDWNFFLTPSRIWELMIGALVAFIPAGRLTAARATNEILSATGLAMVFFAVFFFDHNVPFPGLYALVPTLGAALVILHARSGTVVSRLLSVGPVVGIGLISYSAYLWHQPLFAFARLAGTGTPPVVASLVAATFALAWLSWRYVEMPFRNRAKLKRRHVFALSGASALVLVVAGGIGAADGGLPSRYAEPEYSFFRTLNELSNHRRRCLLQNIASLDRNAPCLIGDTSEVPTMFVWGDSHAEALASGLDEVLAAKKRSALVFDEGGCAPLAGAMQKGNRQRDRDCLRQNSLVMDFLLGSHTGTVVLVARWDSYAHFADFVPIEALSHSSCREEAGGFVRALHATLCLLHEKQIDAVIVRQVPELNYDPIAAMYDRTSGKLETAAITFPVGYAEYLSTPGNLALDAAVSGGEILVDPYYALCDPVRQLCKVAENGVPIFRDMDHLSGRGAKLLAPLLLE